jgi:hypothetical protein
MMSPGDVRRRILDDHRRIRSLLDRIDNLAEQAPRDAGAASSLRMTSLTALRFLLHHIDLEDAILAPALQEADAWGAVRVDELHATHARQRREFRALSATLRGDGGELSTVIEAMKVLSAEVRADMMEEEATLLNVDMLREDGGGSTSGQRG